MSPEQARSDQTITPAADIYSLGVLVYHALAGRLPFQADNDLAMTHKHVSEQPPDLARVVPEIHRNIAKVVMRALRKAPSERWPSAGEFARMFTAAVLQSQSRTTHTSARMSWPTLIMIAAGLVVLASVIIITIVLMK